MSFETEQVYELNTPLNKYKETIFATPVNVYDMVEFIRDSNKWMHTFSA